MKRARKNASIPANVDAFQDDEILSGDESQVEEEEDEEDLETPDEKRIRLAKKYLAEIGDGADNEQDIEEQLQRDADILETKQTHKIASETKFSEPTFYKGHWRTPTCVAISHDDRTFYTGGKDCAIFRWDVETGKKTAFPGKRKDFNCGGHFEQVMGIATTGDDNFCVSVGLDRLVRLWDTRISPEKACVDKFRGHQKAITGVVIEHGTNMIYTSSLDKTVKVWNLAQRTYADSLFGHTEGITAIDMAVKEKLVTGGADKSCRLWKVAHDTHLLFNRHSQPVDCVAALHSTRYLSASQDGDILAWTTASKKPFGVGSQAHGGNWITALGGVRFSDLAFSGSCDGKMRIWQVDEKASKKSNALAEIGAIDTPGYINQIAVSNSGKLLVAAVGKEHKFGRWSPEKPAKNGVQIVRLDHSAPPAY